MVQTIGEKEKCDQEKVTGHLRKMKFYDLYHKDNFELFVIIVLVVKHTGKHCLMGSTEHVYMLSPVIFLQWQFKMSLLYLHTLIHTHFCLNMSGHPCMIN